MMLNNIKDINMLLEIVDIKVDTINTSKIYSDMVLLTGVGYRVELIEGNVLRLDVGYSHFVKINVPKEVSVVIDPSGMRFTISSTNKQLRGDTLYNVVSKRSRNPYTGAGIVIISKIDSLRKLKSTKADKTK